MPSIGNRTVNLHTTDRDETVYIGTTHSVSHKDEVALRRTLPKAGQAMRTNVRFERGFPQTSEAATGEKSVTVSIAVTAPAGVTEADIKAYVTDSLTQAAALAGEMSVTGDIHLS